MSDRRFTVAIGEDGFTGEPMSRTVVGGKAFSLARMAAFGLRVPPAFVVKTSACTAYFEGGQRLPSGLMDEVRDRMRALEAASGRTFGRGEHPLLVSVRSGAPVSMPGMMDTVLNLGMGDEVEAALARETGSPSFARDTHRRFLEMFARIVLKAAIDDLAPDAPPAEWRAIVEKGSGRLYPYDAFERLELAIGAVFESFHSRRAKKYREHQGIAHDIGTAVTVQAMVFGNLDERSGTGVLFSRNPLTGAAAPYGEYLPRAQGEDVVSGTCDPLPLDALRERLPEVHGELLSASSRLEREERDVLDIEFTVQKGVLYFLQSRPAKRAPRAAARLAVAFVEEARIDEDEALARISSEQARALLRPRLAREAEGAAALARGESAGPGVGQGRVVTDADEAERRRQAGESVVLVRQTTSPEDVHGMLSARAVVTETGGSTSHAAVVGRALGLPCVVGCGAGVSEALVGRDVTVDGDRGVVFEGLLPLEIPDESRDADLRALTEWAEAKAPLRVIALGSSEDDASVFELGPETVDCERAELVKLLLGKSRARGAVLETHTGIVAAIEAGVEVVIVRHRLPALLSALEVARKRAG